LLSTESHHPGVPHEAVLLPLRALSGTSLSPPLLPRSTLSLLNCSSSTLFLLRSYVSIMTAVVPLKPSCPFPAFSPFFVTFTSLSKLLFQPIIPVAFRTSTPFPPILRDFPTVPLSRLAPGVLFRPASPSGRLSISAISDFRELRCFPS